MSEEVTDRAEKSAVSRKGNLSPSSLISTYGVVGVDWGDVRHGAVGIVMLTKLGLIWFQEADFRPAVEEEDDCTHPEYEDHEDDG